MEDEIFMQEILHNSSRQSSKPCEQGCRQHSKEYIAAVHWC